MKGWEDGGDEQEDDRKLRKRQTGRLKLHSTNNFRQSLHLAQSLLKANIQAS